MSDAAKASVAPKASRLALPRWLDPKLLLGVLMVLVAVLLGVRVFASMDDSVQVWALKDDVVAGAPVTGQDVVAVSVRFFSDDQARQYISAADPFPAGQLAARDLGKHQLLPVAALSHKHATKLLDMPVPVKPDNLPPLHPQDRVNIVVVTKAGSDHPTFSMVLSNVEVVSTPSSGGSALGVGSPDSGVLTVRVDPASQPHFDQARVAGLLGTGNVVVVHDRS